MTNTQNRITKISFLLVEEFSMIAFASALEPLRTANRISKKKLFEWEFLSLNNQKVFCSNGISIDTQNLNEEKLQTDILFVCGGINIKDKINKKLLAALRRISRNGKANGGAPARSLQGEAGRMEVACQETEGKAEKNEKEGIRGSGHGCSI